MTVKVLHLIDGMDIIGEVVEGGRDFIVKHPLIMTLVEDYPTPFRSVSKLVFSKLLYCSTDNEVVFDKQHVLYQFHPSEEIDRRYRSAISGLLLPPKKMLVE